MMRRRYLAGIFVKELSGASGGMTDRGKGKTFRSAGGRSSNLLLDDGMYELDFQTALHVLVHAHIRDAIAIIIPAKERYIAMGELINTDAIQLFEDKKIRTAWDEEQEEWYFSIVDVISVLTGTENPRRYWSDLKRKLKKEGAVELYEKIVQLKMLSSDGKRYKTDVANTEQLLRIIQSVPSPKAEPFKAWLARVGRERIEETIDPEQAIDRALETYLKKGYSEEWVHQRLLAIRIRNELTDEWQKRGVEKGKEYAILTDEISRAWSGMTTRQYKKLKGLKKENLRDNMSDLELVLTMLAEATTTEISKTVKPATFSENQKVAQKGGSIAGNTRKEIEDTTGKPVITSQNAKDFRQLITDIVEDAAAMPEQTEEKDDNKDE